MAVVVARLLFFTVVSLVVTPIPLKAQWLQKDQMPEISQSSAVKLVGNWRFYNCDLEVRLVPSARLCPVQCDSSLHVFLFDRVRKNVGLATIRVTNTADARVAALGLTDGKIFSDGYRSTYHHLSFFDRGARSWLIGTRLIGVAKDELASKYNSRWKVWCGPRVGDP